MPRGANQQKKPGKGGADNSIACRILCYPLSYWQNSKPKNGQKMLPSMGANLLNILLFEMNCHPCDKLPKSSLTITPLPWMCSSKKWV